MLHPVISGFGGNQVSQDTVVKVDGGCNSSFSFDNGSSPGVSESGFDVLNTAITFVAVVIHILGLVFGVAGFKDIRNNESQNNDSQCVDHFPRSELQRV